VDTAWFIRNDYTKGSGREKAKFDKILYNYSGLYFKVINEKNVL